MKRKRIYGGLLAWAISIRFLETQNHGPYRLGPTNVLQSLDIQNFLAQFPLAVSPHAVLRSCEISRALKKSGKRLCRHMIVFIIRVHVAQARIGVTVTSVFPLLIRVCPIRYRM